MILPDLIKHDEVVKEELDKIVKIGHRKLPDKCRTIFMLSRFSGLTYKEIADKLNISIKTVEAQISIALKRYFIFYLSLDILYFSSFNLFRTCFIWF